MFVVGLDLFLQSIQRVERCRVLQLIAIGRAQTADVQFVDLFRE